jgi:hypothetical protein
MSAYHDRAAMLRSELLKNERALLGQRSEAALCLLVMPHTLLKGARSVRASKIAPNPLSKKLFQTYQEQNRKPAEKSLT